jgi:pimeloyl-ACP methyl ester carboxylesterase
MHITVNNIRLHVSQQDGNGPALVFLHYWGGSSRTWRAVIDALPAGYRSLAPDLRGWGDSDAPANNAYALTDFAADVEHLVAALDLKQYVLVGHSMGGKIAQLLASRRPQGLQGLVLVATAPPTPLALPPEARAAMESAYNSPESVGMSIDHMLTAKPLSAAQRDQVITDSLRGAPQARVAWPSYTSRKDISEDVTKIAVPTIVIAGELDKVDPVAVLQAEVLSRIPQATLRVLPGTGHLSPLESAPEMAGLIADFVASLA